MRKAKKVLFLSLCLVFALSCLTACMSGKYRKLQKVEPEVSYGYTTVSANEIIKDGVVYSYEDMVHKLTKKSHSTYIVTSRVVGDYYYFFYEYNSHTVKQKTENGNSYSYHIYDIGLFRVDLNTITCELVYDFKNFYPTGSGSAHPEGHMARFLDDNRIIIQYNGAIQILDFQRGEITDSKEVYDKEEYKADDFFPYHFNEYGDYAVLKDNVVDYYEIDGYTFKLHQYAVDSRSYYVYRLGDLLYTARMVKFDMEYLTCYNLKTDEKVDLEVLHEEMEKADAEEPQPDEEEEKLYEIGGKNYYLNHVDKKSLEILDENKNQIIVIDQAYMLKNSKPFVELYDLWTKRHGEYELTYFRVRENKLYFVFEAEYGWGATTPSYSYEYDIENDKVYYVGFGGVGEYTRFHEKT